jgi:hypothetical protein
MNFSVHPFVCLCSEKLYIIQEAKHVEILLHVEKVTMVSEVKEKHCKCVSQRPLFLHVVLN